jgi:hypothetical protein
VSTRLEPARRYRDTYRPTAVPRTIPSERGGCRLHCRKT